MADILVDDDFEDLTGNSAPQGGRGRNAPPPPNPIAAGQPGGELSDKDRKKFEKDRAKELKKFNSSQAAQTAAGEKKKHTLLTVLLIVIPTLLVGGFIFEEIYYNFLGTRDWMRDALVDAAIWIDPETASVKNRLDERGGELDKREAAIETREAQQDDRKSQLDARKAQLDERESGLSERERQLATRSTDLDRRERELDEDQYLKTPIYKRAMTAQEIEDMESLARTFTNMTPETASDILVRLYDPHDVAAILYFMSEKSAAAIMSVFDPVYAANITEIFLYD